MKITRINILIGNVLLKEFKKRLANEIDYLLKSGILDNILDYVSEEDIRNSINGVYLNGDCIAISNDLNGKILRLLEYGGPKLKATRILTKCVRQIGGELL